MVWVNDGEWDAEADGKKGKGKGQMAGMFQMFAAMMQMKGKGKGFGGGGEVSAAAPQLTWKSQLNQAYGKTHKEVITKETIIYTTEKTDDGFTCSITSDKFEEIHSAEGSSAKHAQELASKAALEAEFPTFFSEANAPQKPSPKSAAGASAAPADPARKLLPWRSQLGEAYARKHKGITKDSITYETTQCEDDAKKFVSTVASENFIIPYTGEPGLSKRFAEDNAALEAMKAEFPLEYKSSATPKTNKAWKKEKKKAQNEDGGEKRKAEINQDAKSMLNAAMMSLATTPVTKGSITYDTTEADGSCSSTVVITCAGPQKKFSGEAVGTGKSAKKEAENKAAEAAMKGMQKQIAAGAAAAAVKKQEKDEKKKSDWEVLLAKKKEEKAAEKAAKAKA